MTAEELENVVHTHYDGILRYFSGNNIITCGPFSYIPPDKQCFNKSPHLISQIYEHGVIINITNP